MSAPVFLFAAAILLCCTAIFESKKVQLWSIFFILSMVWGGNHYNGSDWLNYVANFNTLSQLPLPEAMSESPFELGFTFLLWVTGKAALNYWVVVAAIGMFNAYALCRLLAASDIRDPGPAAAFLFLVEGWILYQEQLRQSIAVSLVILAILETLRRRYIVAGALVLFGATMHGTALFGLLLIHLTAEIARRNGEPPPPLTTVMWAAATGFATLFILVLTQLGVFYTVGLDRIGTKLDTYQGDSTYGTSLFTAGTLAYAVCVPLLLVSYPIIKRERKELASLAWSAALFWCVAGPFFRVFAVFIRFEHYLLVLMPLAFFVYQRQEPSDRMVARWLSVAALLYASTFSIRQFLQPENFAWSRNYQNAVVNTVLLLPLTDVQSREQEICEGSADYGANLCNLAN